MDMENITREFEENLKCSVCTNIFDNPVSLKCNHKLCEKCFEEAFPGPAEMLVNCPLCKDQCVKGDVKPDHLVKNLVEPLRLMSQGASGVTGQMCACGRSQVSKRCKDCRAFICKSCVSSHNAFLSCKDHVLENIDDLKLTAIQGLNEIHKFQQNVISRYESSIERLQSRQDMLDKNNDEFLGAMKLTEKLWHQAIEKYFHEQTIKAMSENIVARSIFAAQMSLLQECRDRQSAKSQKLQDLRDVISQIPADFDPEKFLADAKKSCAFNEGDIAIQSVSEVNPIMEDLTLDDAICGFTQEFLNTSNMCGHPAISKMSWGFPTSKHSDHLTAADDENTDTFSLGPTLTARNCAVKDETLKTEPLSPETESRDQAEEPTFFTNDLKPPVEENVIPGDTERETGARGKYSEFDEHPDSMVSDTRLMNEAAAFLESGGACGRPDIGCIEIQHDLELECQSIAEFRGAVSRIALINNDLWILPYPSQGTILVYDPSGTYKDKLLVENYDRKFGEIPCNILAVAQCSDGNIVVACHGFSKTVSLSFEVGLLQIDSYGTILELLLNEKCMDVTSFKNEIYALLERGEIRQYQNVSGKWERMKEIHSNRGPDRILAFNEMLYLSNRYNQKLLYCDTGFDDHKWKPIPLTSNNETGQLSLYLCCPRPDGSIVVADQFSCELLLIEETEEDGGRNGWHVVRLKQNFTPLDAVQDRRGILWIISRERGRDGKHFLYKLS